MHIGQAKIAARVVEGEPLVIEAEQVQDRRLHVVNVDGIFDDVEAEFVGRAISDARFHTPPASDIPQARRSRQSCDLFAQDLFDNSPSVRTELSALLRRKKLCGAIIAVPPDRSFSPASPG